MYYKRLLYIGLIALMIVTWGCSKEAPRIKEAVNVGFSIKAEPSEGADSFEPAETPESQDELILSWWIAFVRKSDGVVVDIAEGVSSGVYEDNVEAILPEDDYYAYAFANISRQELYENTGLQFEIGQNSPLHSEIKDAIWQDMKNDEERADGIPMSGWRLVTVKGHVSERFAIEVVRMWAKVEFCFKNESGADIVVRSVNFGPLCSGPIPLMPDALNENQAPDILEGCGVGRVLHSFGEGIAVPTEGGEIKRGKMFVRESVADSDPTGHFNFTLSITRAGKDNEEVMFAVADYLTWINRNDYILIPIVFTDMTIDVDVRFYPPIGGYPPVMVAPSDNEIHATFGTSGSFEILVNVNDMFKGHEVDSSMVSVRIGSISGDVNIFDLKPRVESSGEITGVLGSSEGTAAVPLEISVLQESGLERVYRRILYVIRRNN